MVTIDLQPACVMVTVDLQSANNGNRYSIPWLYFMKVGFKGRGGGGGRHTVLGHIFLMFLVKSSIFNLS